MFIPFEVIFQRFNIVIYLKYINNEHAHTFTKYVSFLLTYVLIKC